MENIGDEIKKIFAVGLHAVSNGTHKTEDVLKGLVEKGEISMEQAKEFSKEKIEHAKASYAQSAIGELFTSKEKRDHIVEHLKTMAKDDIAYLQSHIGEILGGKKEEEASQTPDEPTETENKPE